MLQMTVLCILILAFFILLIYTCIYIYIYIYIYICIYIYAVLKIMSLLSCHHNGFVATHILWHMVYYLSIHHVPKCMSCHKVIVVIVGSANDFHGCIFITLILLLWDLRNNICFYVLAWLIDDVINFKLYLQSFSQAMADRRKKMKMWLSWEQKKLLRWSKKKFHSF